VCPKAASGWAVPVYNAAQIEGRMSWATYCFYSEAADGAPNSKNALYSSYRPEVSSPAREGGVSWVGGEGGPKDRHWSKCRTFGAHTAHEPQTPALRGCPTSTFNLSGGAKRRQ
jgi:hypothetical protein